MNEIKTLADAKAEIVKEWGVKWSNDTSEKILFKHLCEKVYDYLKEKTEEHKNKNFWTKLGYLAVIIAATGICSFLIVKYCISGQVVGAVLAKSGVILFLAFLISNVITKLLDIKKYQETWVRHSTHKFLIEQEMLLYIQGVIPYNDPNKDEVFIKRFLEIEEKNQEKFVKSMGKDEMSLLDFFDKLRN